jgi:hypothetical protein
MSKESLDPNQRKSRRGFIGIIEASKAGADDEAREAAKKEAGRLGQIKKLGQIASNLPNSKRKSR